MMPSSQLGSTVYLVFLTIWSSLTYLHGTTSNIGALLIAYCCRGGDGTSLSNGTGQLPVSADQSRISAVSRGRDGCDVTQSSGDVSRRHRYSTERIHCSSSSSSSITPCFIKKNRNQIQLILTTINSNYMKIAHSKHAWIIVHCDYEISVVGFLTVLCQSR